MKTVYFRTLFIALLCVATGHVTAQNKSLGVGTSTPNPNAALHVESPTSNQGFIMPRLTTAQRTGMAGLLAAADEGLMLFDTDLNTIYIWDGATWRTTGELAGGSKLSYPYKDSVTTNPPPGVFDVFALKYNGTVNSRVMRVESLSPTNLSSALSVQQQGRGLAGFFEQFNDTTLSTALFARVRTNRIAGPGQLAPVAVYGEATGVGALGGAFWVTNPSNNFAALYTRTLGTGNSARFETLNTSNGAAAVAGVTNGVGRAGEFIINNPASTAAAVTGEANGDVGSAGVYANQIGTGRGMIAQINNAGNTQSAFLAQTNGTGPAIVANQSNGGLALDVLSGGIKVPVTQLSGDDVIPNNAVVVELTGATQIVTTPTGGQNGQIIYVFNTGAGSSTVAGINLDPQRGVAFVRLSGNWIPMAISLP